MSHRICFIGDSQVAALRQALDDPRASAHADRIAIYGSRGQGLFSLRDEDGSLVTDEKKVRQDLKFTGGSRAIKLRKYDAFCVVGSLVKLEWTDEIVRDYATIGMGLSGRRLVSENLMRQMFEEAMRQTLAYHLLGLVEGAGKPVFFIPCPLHSEGIVGHERGAVIRSMIEAGLGDDYFARFARARDAIIGPKATIIHQPEETIAPPFFTKRAYGLGSIRLTKHRVEHGDDDFGHMNQDFGVLMLSKALNVIDAALPAVGSGSDQA